MSASSVQPIQIYSLKWKIFQDREKQSMHWYSKR